MGKENFTKKLQEAANIIFNAVRNSCAGNGLTLLALPTPFSFRTEHYMYCSNNFMTVK